MPRDGSLVAPTDPVFRDAFDRFMRLTINGMCVAAESRVRAEYLMNPDATSDELRQAALSSLRMQAYSLVCAIDDVDTCRETLRFLLTRSLASFVPAIVENATLTEGGCRSLPLMH
ncbi:MAG: hypothetical protein AB1806_15275 [Acidobacteriota bacterium]